MQVQDFLDLQDTYCFHDLLFLIQKRVAIESTQQVMLGFYGQHFRTAFTSCANINAPSNSSWEIDCFLTGATLVLDEISRPLPYPHYSSQIKNSCVSMFRSITEFMCFLRIIGIKITPWYPDLIQSFKFSKNLILMCKESSLYLQETIESRIVWNSHSDEFSYLLFF